MYREYHTTDQLIFSIIFGVQYMHYCVVLLCEVYSRTSTNGHLFTTATFSPSVPADSPYITSCLNLSKTATSPQWQRPVFSATDEKVNNNCMARWRFTRQSHFDSAPFINTAAVSINCPATILIALRTLHVFSCWHFDSKHYLIFLSLYFISIYYFRWIPRWIRRSQENANPNDSTFSSPQTSTAFKIKDSDCARNIEHFLAEKLYTLSTLIPSINLILPTEDIFSQLLGFLRLEPLLSIQGGRFSV